MGWWKADPPADQQTSEASTCTATNAAPRPPHPVSSATSASASECPVDPKTRSIWLQAAKAQQQTSQRIDSDSSNTLPTNHPVVSTAVASSKECSSDRIDQSLPSQHSQQQTYQPGALRPLSHDREVSTIPRAYPFSQQASTDGLPSNSESETGYDKGSGNWIYPSETQFFNAVMKKQKAASPKELASSVSSIIPIHNAVNERAWHMIRAWEGNSSDRCGGPKLLRFEGKGAGAKSPRAVIKSWSGYTEPFDRHDWTVQRCDGTEVDYVIDFYQGKPQFASGQASASSASQQGLAGTGAGINFFLDVRPKLNSLEGCKMRLERACGWR